MTRSLLLIVLLGPVATAPAQAAEQSAERPKAVRNIERALDTTGSAIEKAGSTVRRGVEKGADHTGKAITSAGKKTEKWIKDKTN
jgi:hypothetical protein